MIGQVEDGMRGCKFSRTNFFIIGTIDFGSELRRVLVGPEVNISGALGWLGLLLSFERNKEIYESFNHQAKQWYYRDKPKDK